MARLVLGLEAVLRPSSRGLAPGPGAAAGAGCGNVKAEMPPPPMAKQEMVTEMRGRDHLSVSELGHQAWPRGGTDLRLVWTSGQGRKEAAPATRLLAATAPVLLTLPRVRPLAPHLGAGSGKCSAPESFQ